MLLHPNALNSIAPSTSYTDSIALIETGMIRGMLLMMVAKMFFQPLVLQSCAIWAFRVVSRSFT